MRNFEITFFYGPAPKDILRKEVISDIAQSGITLVPLQRYDTPTNQAVLPLLKDFGLKASVWDPRIRALYAEENLDAVDAVVKEVVADYKHFDNVIGWELCDEPSAAKFPILSALVEAFRRHSPEKETVINLFPNYATPKQLGNPDYSSHLESFVKTVKPHFLSYDHYHFRGREKQNSPVSETVSEREQLIRLSAETCKGRPGFFENMELVRRVGLQNHLNCMMIMLLTEHGPYRNLTRQELFWEANMCLAYGMKRLSYFTYWEPEKDEYWQWNNAMCDTEGNRMSHYYDARTINRALSPIGGHLFATESCAVFHIRTPEPETTAFTSYQNITSIDGENGVIGFFKDGSLYLVNRDFRRENTFILHTAKQLYHMTNGTFQEAKEKRFTLKAGEAVLLKQ